MLHVLDKFAALKQEQFTGQLQISGGSGETWILYFFLGRLLYGTGGKHSVRRLYRYLEANLNLTLEELSELQNEWDHPQAACWEYEFLSYLVKQNYLAPGLMPKIISSILNEILFDLTYTPWARHTLQLKLAITEQLGLVDPVHLLKDQHSTWPQWQADRYKVSCLHQAPVIGQADRLQKKTTPSAYRLLVDLLDGERTLWDLVAKMNCSPAEVLRSLMPYIQSGMLELVDVPDLPGPNLAPPGRSTTPAQSNFQRPLVACVSDRAWVCQLLEQVVKATDCGYLTIQEPLKALPLLLMHKPQLVLLDAKMVEASGYEICSQLRQIAAFSETPIILLTGRDGLVDRVRAKLVGATDCLTNGIGSTELLAVLKKYLILQPDRTLAMR